MSDKDGFMHKSQEVFSPYHAIRSGVNIFFLSYLAMNIFGSIKCSTKQGMKINETDVCIEDYFILDDPTRNVEDRGRFICY